MNLFQTAALRAQKRATLSFVEERLQILWLYTFIYGAAPAEARY